MKKTTKPRSGLLDSLRGITVIQMVLYHAIWDLVYIFGVKWPWFSGIPAYIWQQSICWTFILLSGFCSAMSRRPIRRGLTVFGIGAAVTLVTALFMPEDIVVFGVLTLIGSCMLLMPLLKKGLVRVPPVPGAILSFGLFLFTKKLDMGWLGFFGIPLVQLPDFLYQNYFTAYFGFCPKGFFSTDYFPLFPWIFLFITGYFLHRLRGGKLLQISRRALHRSIVSAAMPWRSTPSISR